MALFLDVNGRRYALHADHAFKQVEMALDDAGNGPASLKLSNGSDLTVRAPATSGWVLEEEHDRDD